MPMTVHVSRLASHVGRELGVSGWLRIEQHAIDAFARVTGDEQWLHTDPARAAGGPFGSTVAHGLLTLSLLPALASEIYRIEGVQGRINYGYDRVRFPEPVRTGSRVRDRIVLDDAASANGGVRVRLTHTVEIENSARPACVANALLHLVPEENR